MVQYGKIKRGEMPRYSGEKHIIIALSFHYGSILKYLAFYTGEVQPFLEMTIDEQKE